MSCCPFPPIFASFVVVDVVVCVGFGVGFEVCKFAVCLCECASSN